VLCLSSLNNYLSVYRSIKETEEKLKKHNFDFKISKLAHSMKNFEHASALRSYLQRCVEGKSALVFSGLVKAFKAIDFSTFSEAIEALYSAISNIESISSYASAGATAATKGLKKAYDAVMRFDPSDLLELSLLSGDPNFALLDDALNAASELLSGVEDGLISLSDSYFSVPASIRLAFFKFMVNVFGIKESYIHMIEDSLSAVKSADYSRFALKYGKEMLSEVCDWMGVDFRELEGIINTGVHLYEYFDFLVSVGGFSVEGIAYTAAYALLKESGIDLSALTDIPYDVGRALGLGKDEVSVIIDAVLLAATLCLSVVPFGRILALVLKILDLIGWLDDIIFFVVGLFNPDIPRMKTDSKRLKTATEHVDQLSAALGAIDLSDFESQVELLGNEGKLNTNMVSVSYDVDMTDSRTRNSVLSLISRAGTFLSVEEPYLGSRLRHLQYTGSGYTPTIDERAALTYDNYLETGGLKPDGTTLVSIPAIPFSACDSFFMFPRPIPCYYQPPLYYTTGVVRVANPDWRSQLIRQAIFSGSLVSRQDHVLSYALSLLYEFRIDLISAYPEASPMTYEVGELPWVFNMQQYHFYPFFNLVSFNWSNETVETMQFFSVVELLFRTHVFSAAEIAEIIDGSFVYTDEHLLKILVVAEWVRDGMIDSPKINSAPEVLASTIVPRVNLETYIKNVGAQFKYVPGVASAVADDVVDIEISALGKKKNGYDVLETVVQSPGPSCYKIVMVAFSFSYVIRLRSKKVRAEFRKNNTPTDMMKSFGVVRIPYLMRSETSSSRVVVLSKHLAGTISEREKARMIEALPDSVKLSSAEFLASDFAYRYTNSQMQEMYRTLERQVPALEKARPSILAYTTTVSVTTGNLDFLLYCPSCVTWYPGPLGNLEQHRTHRVTFQYQFSQNVYTLSWMYSDRCFQVAATYDGKQYDAGEVVHPVGLSSLRGGTTAAEVTADFPSLYYNVQRTLHSDAFLYTMTITMNTNYNPNSDSFLTKNVSSLTFSKRLPQTSEVLQAMILPRATVTKYASCTDLNVILTESNKIGGALYQ